MTDEEEDVEVPKTGSDLSVETEQIPSPDSKSSEDAAEMHQTRRLLNSLAVSMSPQARFTRRDHMHKLYMRRQVGMDMIRRSLATTSALVPHAGAASVSRGAPAVPDPRSQMLEKSVVANQLKLEMEEEAGFKLLSARAEEVMELMKDFQDLPEAADAPLEVRVDNLTYTVTVDTELRIETVFNTSWLYPIYKWYRVRFRGEQRKPRVRAPKNVLDHISLVFKPGKMYLVLGPPGSGKSSLLRAITGLLKPAKEETLDGSIYYNGKKLEDADGLYIDNAFAYIDQLDKHSPRLSVAETMEYAFQLKSGGKFIRDEERLVTEKAREAHRRANRTGLPTKLCLAGLGLTRVKDTFVGDTNVRGVSGGQRRRVTVGEMLMSRVPVLCGDEISTGLDAASTFDMIQLLSLAGKRRRYTRIISLLQPSPETVSLFDCVVLLGGEGFLIYAGPVVEVEEYFSNLGYVAPDYIDVADFLQMVSTPEGATLYHPNEEIRKIRPIAPSPGELAELFRQSKYGQDISSSLRDPPSYVWKQADSIHGAEVSGLGMTTAVNHRYANSFLRSTWLILKRFLVLWLRDKRVIAVGAVKNILMGVSVGGVFSNTEDPISLQGALFQAGLFIMLGAMQSSMGLVEDRVIFYKHKNANFHSAWPFVFGRTIAQVPQTIVDTLMFGILLYYIVGLGGREEGSYLFTYLAILFVFNLTMTQQLSVFAAFLDSSSAQAMSACVMLFMMLFGGFILAPDSIPKFFWWIYWWNPFAWCYRSLVVLEFRSPRWEDPDAVLFSLGFVTPDGDPFDSRWIGYGFYAMIPYFLLCCIFTALGLTFFEKDAKSVPEPKASSSCPKNSVEAIEIPFKTVNLSFHNISYEVKASTTKEKLLLLNNVNGVFCSGRMCALMGESGAGKTTLMDVIALRKRSGTVRGEVLLNGWEQDPVSFRRCSGYVEQFDVQSPQLSVKETIMFSARLRIDPSLVPSDHDIEKFVEYIMEQVELTPLAAVLVGTDESGGLSFEQKKRLSIAVELAASPSVIFLDEPTSGLDARSALLVVKTLKKISESGRTICATIHQPSSIVFDMFDDLLLLKRGGHVVYHGELGPSSKTMTSYFESKGAPTCEPGENPANWMLRVLAMDSVGDLAQTFADSKEFVGLSNTLADLKSNRTDEGKIHFDSDFAVSSVRRRQLVNRRIRTIYWRSPAYNLARMSVSVVIAFVLGSVFILKWDKTTFTEIEMRDRLSVVFLSFIIVGIMAILSVLPVMTMIRDMYYRHRDAGMYGSGALGWALGVAEKWFLVLGSVFFTVVFLSTSHIGVGQFSVGFWGFFTFNFALYSYFGQAFVCLVKPKKTAFILASVLIGLNNFFSGLIVRPQFMLGTFFALPYYITPGHYVYEGLVISLFGPVDGTVTAEQNSEFFEYLVEKGRCTADEAIPCEGTTDEYIESFFGEDFTGEHTLRNALILGGILVLVRVTTWLALQFVRFA